MKERLLITSLNLSLIYAVCLFAFSRKTREKIWERDGGVCQSCGLSQSVGHLECSHQNHDRRSPDYDDAENGALQCLVCHYLFHLFHKGIADQIGMKNERDNDRAIQGVYERMNVYEKNLLKTKLKPKQKEMFEKV